MDCGEGTDTVDVDAAIPTGGGDPVATDTVADCETVNLVP